MKYTVTKKFLKGILAGTTATIQTNVNFEEGKTYNCCCSTGSYIVISCKETAKVESM